MNFGRIITAMVTPFDRNENIDFQATKILVEHLIANGTDGLVVAGTTGESPTLSMDEKKELFSYVVDVVNGRVPVIAGTGTNNTKESIELTQYAEKVGTDGVMLVTPYYNKPSQEGLYQHFKTIAQSTALPVMLYNIPGRSIVNMSVETTVKLSFIENIVAIKEASADLDQMTAIISQTPDDFSLYSGDDSLTLPILSIGGAGVVSVSAHVLGNEMKQMVNDFFAGNVAEAASAHRNLLPIMKAMFSSPSPTPVKTALNLYGIHVGNVRLPLVPLNEEERDELQQVLQLNSIKAI